MAYTSEHIIKEVLKSYPQHELIAIRSCTDLNIDLLFDIVIEEEDAGLTVCEVDCCFRKL